MGQRFQGSAVFITGGSSGIGAALGRQFAAEGARVALAARRVERLEGEIETIRQAGGEGIAVACDVTSRESLDAAVAEAVEAFGKLDVVVANAGFSVNGPFERLTTGDFRRQFDTNVYGAIDTVYAALPHLLASQGRLALVSSVFGRLGGPNSSAYCASKFALCGFAECLYYELAAKGVAVTLLNPGIVATEIRKVNNKGEINYAKKETSPPRLTMPAETAARHMADAIYKRKFEAVITNHGKVAVSLSRHFPRTFRAVIRRLTKGKIEKVEKVKRPEPTPDP